MKTVLFIGNHHRPNDPRLCHRQMKTLSAVGKVNFLMVKIVYQTGLAALSVRRETATFDHIDVDCIEILAPLRDIGWGVLRWGRRLADRRRAHKAFLEISAGLSFDVLQASDARELRLALKVAKNRSVTLVYDSHEDYVRQILDYQGISFKSILQAVKIYFDECVYVRSFDAVFCTDDFLLKKYGRWWYGQKKVFLLRNFPLYWSSGKDFGTCVSNCLRLVYIGGVNEFRGVRECAEFTRRFNAKQANKSLSFTVIGTHHKLLDRYSDEPWFHYEPWIDYAQLVVKLAAYDVGVCLWQNIEKFKRNLPLKNFDYMAVGLPIVTSNFGLLKHYLDLAGAGIGIDPSSFEQFEEAVLRLFDVETRRKFSFRGLQWVRQGANFEKEAEPYRRIVLETPPVTRL